MKCVSRYGGTYLDLDVISQKALDEIPEKNFVCAQFDKLSGNDSLANGLLSLEDKSTGHYLAELFLKQVSCFSEAWLIVLIQLFLNFQ